jgi:hypothetical protein
LFWAKSCFTEVLRGEAHCHDANPICPSGQDPIVLDRAVVNIPKIETGILGDSLFGRRNS